MLDDFGNGKITVQKSALLEVIKKNRDTHIAAYEEALEGYKKEAVRLLQVMLKEAKAGEVPPPSHNDYVCLARPTDHRKDYDRVISMMEMSEADQIVVTEKQYARYALDEWEWSNAFTEVASSYTNKR